MGEFVDDGDDDSALDAIYFEDEDVSVAVFVHNAEVVVAVGGASEHGVALCFGEVVEDLVDVLDAFSFGFELEIGG